MSGGTESMLLLLGGGRFGVGARKLSGHLCIGAPDMVHFYMGCTDWMVRLLDLVLIVVTAHDRPFWGLERWGQLAQTISPLCIAVNLYQLSVTPNGFVVSQQHRFVRRSKAHIRVGCPTAAHPGQE